MKILTRLFFLSVAVIWSLHYYCNVLNCSTQLQTVCYYTTPSLWEKTLEKNELYRNQLSPKIKILKDNCIYHGSQYRKKIMPKIVNWGNYFYLEVLSPRIEAVCDFVEEFDSKPYRKWTLIQIRRLRRKLWFCYSVYLRVPLVKLDSRFSLSEKYGDIRDKILPVVEEFVDEAARYLKSAYLEMAVEIQPYWESIISHINANLKSISSKLWKRCRTNEFCFKTNVWFRALWSDLKTSYFYLTAYIQDALAPYAGEVELHVPARKTRSKLNSKVKSKQSLQRLKRDANFGNSVRSVSRANMRASSDTVRDSILKENPTVSTSNTKKSTKTKVSYDDDDDEAPYTITSTIMVTVTSDGEPNEMISSLENTTGAELEISERNVVKAEFEAWFRVIDQKSSGILKVFDKEVDKYLHKRVQDLDSVFQNKTRNISEALHKHYKLLNRAIQDVNCTCETDSSSGNVTCFDRSGTTQLSEYITRARMREFFAEAHSTLSRSMLQLKQDLESLPREIDQRINLIREEMVEVYEEWGDAMISEWSKRLAYVDVLAGHSDDSVNEESSENWRNFLGLKKKVIGTRDDLVKHPANLQEIRQFVKKVHYLVEVLSQEAGEYLYILRARANLAFQAREEETNKREDSPRMDIKSGRKSASVNGTTTTARIKKKGNKLKNTKKGQQNSVNASSNLYIALESDTTRQ